MKSLVGSIFQGTEKKVTKLNSHPFKSEKHEIVWMQPNFLKGNQVAKLSFHKSFDLI